MGSRYGGLKQIDPVGPNGETVLDYSVYDALAAGFGKLVFVIRREFEAVFREKVGRRFESRVDVRYVNQELESLPGGAKTPAARQKPWGTGHAVWCAARELTEAFAVINADDFYGADSFRQLGRFLSATDRSVVSASACMIGFSLCNTLSPYGAVSRGICSVDEQGQLVTVTEATGIESWQVDPVRRTAADGRTIYRGDEIVSMNCWGFTPAIFPSLERQLSEFLSRRGQDTKAEFYLPAAVTEMIAEREASVRVLPTSSSWFGVTYREDRAQVTSALQVLVQAGVYPERLWP